MNLFLIFQSTLIIVLVSLAVVFLGVMFSDGECILQLLCLYEKNESLTFKECISQLLGVSEENKNKTLTFLGIGMGGVLLALQALMSYRRAKAMEETANAQANAAKAQAKANEHTEQGQRQGRLKNAVEHLGHGAVSVRLGGAYELLHLAQDTPALSRAILDVLCGHIRWTTGHEEYQREHPSKPSEEVQSLLTMLFVQNHEVFRGVRANLQGSCLNGADLEGARLDKANLNGAHLRGAILWQAYLRGADFLEAFLNGAGLGYAHLQGALLSGAKLYGATLSGANLQGAILVEAHLQGTWLIGAQLRGVRSNKERILEIPPTFAERMKASVNQGSDLSGVVFAGGLLPGDVDSIVTGLSNEDEGKLRERLEPHINQSPIYNNLHHLGSGAVTTPYTEEEAEQWIAKYRDEVEG